MSAVIHEPVEPPSGEFRINSPERGVDIEQKHRAVAEFLESHHYDALLLQKPSNFAWFTSGGDCTRAGSSETIAAVFITPDARVIVSSNVDSAEIFERELLGLGFQLKERPWHEPRHLLIDDLCRSRTVASDTGFGHADDVSPQLAGLRTPLTVLECERMRELGRLVSHAVEATARQCLQGETEAEIAGELAHRLIKRQVIPERIQVAADGKNRRYRHWSYGGARAENSCVIAAVGKRWGLCVGAARTVCFGQLPDDVRKAHHRALLMQATGMYFSQPEWEVFEVWNRVQRIYEKFGCTNEWQLADQAEILGYLVNEIPFVPKSEFRISARTAVHWHPSVGPALVADTALVGENGFELLTPMEDWPKVTIEVKRFPIQCPDILRRDQPSENPNDSVLL